jgi:hypothetical protein
MSKFQLYCGIVRGNKWYNFAEVKPLTGGVIAMLDGAEKTGAARLLNLVKGSVSSFFTEEGDEFSLKQNDYEDIKVVDTWKVGYESIKLKTGATHPIIPESFYCNRCSRPKAEQYTDINESWQTLIDQGLIDEIFLKNSDMTFDVELPNPIEIQANKTMAGGTFKTIIMQHISIGDMLKIHRSQWAMSSEANMIRAIWDASIVKIPGMSDVDFNRIKRIPEKSFTGTYLNTQANQDAIEEVMSENVVGIDAKDRVVYCKNCGNEIRDGLDYTNFFFPLLPKKLNHNR